MKPLIVIPTYCKDQAALDLTNICLASVSRTVKDTADVLIVDDGSPLDGPFCTGVVGGAQMELHPKVKNEGFSRTVNVGLRRALEEGRDAILLNADVEFARDDIGWPERFQDEHDLPVQGAVLEFPTEPRLIQHAGVYFSVLRREFDHIYRFGPAELPELDEWRKCPVTGALMFISHDTLENVGLFDEGFRMGWEDVDYCLRVFASGRECWVNPNVRAVHHEQAFRADPTPRRQRWDRISLTRLFDKHAGEDFSQWVPTMLGTD